MRWCHSFTAPPCSDVRISRCGVVEPHDADLVPPGRDEPEEEQPHAVRLPRVEVVRQLALGPEAEQPLGDVAQRLGLLDRVPRDLGGERERRGDPDDQGTKTPCTANSVLGVVEATPSAPPSLTFTWPSCQTERRAFLDRARAGDRIGRGVDRAGGADGGRRRSPRRARSPGRACPAAVPNCEGPLSRSVTRIDRLELQLAGVVGEAGRRAAHVRHRHREACVGLVGRGGRVAGDRR